MIHNFGSINIDHVYRVPHLVAAGETLASLSLETVLGGKGANQSVAIARGGAQVRHIGALGAADDWAREQLQDYGVEVSSVRRVDGASGHAIIQVDDGAENAIVLHGGANHSHNRLTLETALAEAAPGDWLLIQNECNALGEAMALATSKQMQIAFNPAPMDAGVSTLPLGQCALLIVNEVEASQLLTHLGRAVPDNDEATLDALSSAWPDVSVALTVGSRGAWLSHQGERWHEGIFKVDAVDTTGAGDTFVGFLLAGLEGGLEPREALRLANAAAALSVTRAGASPSVPERAEAEALAAERTGGNS